MKSMQEVAISEFKAKCLKLVERVRSTGAPIRITRYGRPIADVVPISPATTTEDWLGSMAGTIKITGDILSPVIEESDIEALQEKH